MLSKVPALPLDEAGKYVAGAYAVFIVLILVYVAIIGAKLARIEKELGTLSELADHGSAESRSSADKDPSSSAAKTVDGREKA